MCNDVSLCILEVYPHKVLTTLLQHLHICCIFAIYVNFQCRFAFILLFFSWTSRICIIFFMVRIHFTTCHSLCNFLMTYNQEWNWENLYTVYFPWNRGCYFYRNYLLVMDNHTLKERSNLHASLFTSRKVIHSIHSRLCSCTCWYASMCLLYQYIVAY